MKAFLKFSITIWLTVGGSALIPVIPQVVDQHATVSAQTLSSLPLHLPLATISFNTNTPILTGRLVQLDPKQRILIVQSAQGQYTVPIRTVRTISFNRKAPAYGSDGQLVLRADNLMPAGQPMTLGPLPLSGLRIHDPVRGMATVKISAKRATPQPTANQTYVVDQLQFDAQQGTVTIVATPYQ
jgi:hypothetical protein